jgi:hypothetical protein
LVRSGGALGAIVVAGVLVAACHDTPEATAAAAMPTGAAPADSPAIAPTSSTVALTSDAIAPTSSTIAPTSGTIPPTSSAVPPASEASLAQTRGAVAPTGVFDSARAWEHLRRQVGFGPRPSGSPAIVETRRYILEQLGSFGIDAREQPFIGMTPLGEVSMANVIATIPGKRPDRLVIASHYDTKLFREFRFVGANDGASSTAALLELGRVLKGRSHEFTIELLFLDGEEARLTEWRGLDNTYGSRHYVQAAQQTGALKGLRALVLLDMIGDRDLVIRRDSNSTPWLVDIIWGAAARLGHAGVFSSQLTTIEDDHIPFLRAGVAAVDLIDLENPTWHTPQDDLEHVSARSLQTVGDVVLAAIPEIEKRLAAGR